MHPDRPFTSGEEVYLLPRGDEPFRRFVDDWLAGALRDGTCERIAEPRIG